MSFIDDMIAKAKADAAAKQAQTTPASTPIVTVTPSLFSLIPTWVWVLGIGAVGFFGYKRFVKKS